MNEKKNGPGYELIQKVRIFLPRHEADLMASALRFAIACNDYAEGSPEDENNNARVEATRPTFKYYWDQFCDKK